MKVESVFRTKPCIGMVAESSFLVERRTKERENHPENVNHSNLCLPFALQTNGFRDGCLIGVTPMSGSEKH